MKIQTFTLNIVSVRIFPPDQISIGYVNQNLKLIQRNKRKATLVKKKKSECFAWSWWTATAIDEIHEKWEIHPCVLCVSHVGVVLLCCGHQIFGVPWLFSGPTWPYTSERCLGLRVWPKWLRIHIFLLNFLHV